MIDLHIQGTHWRITADRNCWALSRVGRNKRGEETVVACHWYIRLEQMADKLAKLGCADGVPNELEAIRSIADLLRALLGDKPPNNTEEDA